MACTPRARSSRCAGSGNGIRQRHQAVIRLARTERDERPLPDVGGDRRRVGLRVLRHAPSLGHLLEGLLRLIDELDVSGLARQLALPGARPDRLDRVGEKKPPRLNGLHGYHGLSAHRGELPREVRGDRAIGIMAVRVAVHDHRCDAAIVGLKGLYCPPQLVDPIANGVRLCLTGQ